MKFIRKPMILGGASLLALTACGDPSQYPGTEGDRTRQGAIAGAAAGALIGGTLESGNDRVRNALVGAALGAAAGGVIGNALDAQAAELRNDFGSGEIDVINTGSELIVRMPEAILFPVDSASLNPQLRSDLFVLSDSLNKYPASIVTVTGHTDNTGSASYNQNLSERRADAVASVLSEGGVAFNRVRVVGAGENQPITTNQNAEPKHQAKSQPLKNYTIISTQL
jgi:outer membrane protein OmpA-like peptidoglycan-associated protein